MRQKAIFTSQKKSIALVKAQQIMDRTLIVVQYDLLSEQETIVKNVGFQTHLWLKKTAFARLILC